MTINCSNFGSNMKYNLEKNKNLMDFKKKNKKDFFKGIKKTPVYSSKMYDLIKNINLTLNSVSNHTGFYHIAIENLARYLQHKEFQTNYLTKKSSPHNLWFDIFFDYTGYEEYWDIKQIRFNNLTKKLYGIDDNNILKNLDNGMVLVWVKL